MPAHARARRLRPLVACAAALLLALPAAAETAWVRGEVRLNLRTGAGSQYRILGVVQTGDRLQILDRREDWTKVRAPDGREGWIPAGYLEPKPPPAVRLERLEDETGTLRSRLEEAEAEAASLREAKQELSADDAEQESAIARLTEENYRLRAGERWAEWLTGALLLGTGMALGALLSRLGRGRKQRLKL